MSAMAKQRVKHSVQQSAPNVSGANGRSLNTEERGVIANLNAAIARSEAQLGEVVDKLVELEGARNRILAQRRELLANRIEAAKNFARAHGMNPDTDPIRLDLTSMAFSPAP